ncbi:hypothetical protein [Rhodococcus phage RGL3]|uniref:Uncharacterized protein n=1 Tax=Rhodococcus phage RGL3 TaxID=2922221 RepID=G9FHN6_9CAUD|nr:hypothetical protein RoPhRGL3_gp44 [Rhodococcus phage RGL3]AEV52124.1 hypothetical protein [Rhodococcus phage RGL3]
MTTITKFNHATIYRITDGTDAGEKGYIESYESVLPDSDNELYLTNVNDDGRYLGYVDSELLEVAGFQPGTQVRITGLSSNCAGQVVEYKIGDLVEVKGDSFWDRDVKIQAEGQRAQHIDPKNLVLAADYVPASDLTVDGELPTGVELIDSLTKNRWVLTPEGVPHLFTSEHGMWITTSYGPDEVEKPRLQTREAHEESLKPVPQVFEHIWNIPQSLSVTDREGDFWKFIEGKGWGLGRPGDADVEFDTNWVNPDNYAPFTEVTA